MEQVIKKEPGEKEGETKEVPQENKDGTPKMQKMMTKDGDGNEVEVPDKSRPCILSKTGKLIKKEIHSVWPQKREFLGSALWKLLNTGITKSNKLGKYRSWDMGSVKPHICCSLISQF